MRALRKRIAEQEAVREASEKSADQRTMRTRKPSVSTHPAFLPMLAIWGAVLGAGSVLVLPAQMAAQIASNAGLSGRGSLTIFTIAVIAAFIVGGIALSAGIGFKRAKGRSSPTGSLASVAARRFVPIDPAVELGSESLDSPIEQQPTERIETAENTSRGPTLGELAANGYELPDEESKDSPKFTRKDYEAALQQTCEGASETDDASEETTIPADGGGPVELDLAQFAALPGRNAVWVEEEIGVDIASEAEPVAALQPAPEPEQEPPDETRVRLSAIEKLRQTPTCDLSLIQMVERFAAALHERQEADLANPGSHTSPKRDAALAEALKALTVLSETGLEIEAELGQVHTAASGNGEIDALRDTTRELRDALTKLQTLRGAA
ncbi:hypothetical protein [Erythrobacter sp. THAF29]|uniref:hypothetical protein n=1 Tax=Erythrobacter sp. THAF29 TaxID=2587851 RepID=UPI0012687868|nr:hypothetical protein [Erythrobacter sp. THAF29]QFT76546.1 hypothetical protein FIU90_03215 [Erythrobacter sp. THAF29]